MRVLAITPNSLLSPPRRDNSVILSPRRADRVRVVTTRHPFRKERLLVELPAGPSVAELTRAVGLQPNMPARVFLDDRVILEGEAERVHPRAGQILTVRAVPAGGGRSKDVELLTIVVAAIAAAATYGTSAYLEASTTFFASATQAGGSSYLAGAVLAGIQGAIAEGAKFALAQAVNVLIPAPSTPTPRAVSTPQSYTVSGTANGAAPFSPIPKIYGARRIFPQYAASPYTEVSGEDQYLRMLFLLGYGPLDISQINIADTAIEDYKDIEWELRAGFTDDAPSRLYPGSVAEQDFSIVLSTTEVDKAPSLSGWMTQTSGPLADELSVDVTFPGGLNAFNSKGAPIPIQCTWQIQWAPAGTQSWTSEPDIVIKSGGVGAVRRGHVWRVPRGQYDVQATFTPFIINGNDTAIVGSLLSDFDSKPSPPKARQSGRYGVRRPVVDFAEPFATSRQSGGIRFLTFRRERRAGPASETCQKRQAAPSGMRIADTLEGNRAMESFFPLLRSFMLGNRCTSRKRRECDYSNGGTSINSHA